MSKTSRNTPPTAPTPNRGRRRSEAAVLSGGTRERLILEAERLFGERGIDGVTMRMVCEAAEQKFAGSVQYHFGDAAGLLYAVFEYRETMLQPLRHKLLENGRKQGRLDDIRYLLRMGKVQMRSIILLSKKDLKIR